MSIVMELIGTLFIGFSEYLLNDDKYSKKEKGKYFFCLVIYIIDCGLMFLLLFLSFILTQVCFSDFSLTISVAALSTLFLTGVFGKMMIRYTMGIVKITKFFLSKS